ncbi:MAG: rhomboid family intramembrane serine protease [Planctomycetota bacterium]
MGLDQRDYGRDDFYQPTPWDRAQKPRSFVLVLIIVTVVVWLLQVSIKTDITDPSGAAVRLEDGKILQKHFITDWFSVKSESLTRPYKIWQTLTYGFLHNESSLAHLVFNMIGLWMFGTALERDIGRWFFLKFYLLAIIFGGIVGSITAIAMSGPEASMTIIGASGGVVAASVLYALRYPHNIIMLFGVLPMKAWILVTGFVILDVMNFTAELTGMGNSGTAVTVHLAGAAFAACAFKQNWAFEWLPLESIGSIEDVQRTMRQRVTRAKLKIHDPDRKIASQELEAVRILEKIHEHGEDSLTAAERKTLQRYSEQKRRARQED